MPLGDTSIQSLGGVCTTQLGTLPNCLLAAPVSQHLMAATTAPILSQRQHGTTILCQGRGAFPPSRPGRVFELQSTLLQV